MKQEKRIRELARFHASIGYKPNETKTGFVRDEDLLQQAQHEAQRSQRQKERVADTGL